MSVMTFSNIDWILNKFQFSWLYLVVQSSSTKFFNQIRILITKAHRNIPGNKHKKSLNIRKIRGGLDFCIDRPCEVLNNISKDPIVNLSVQLLGNVAKISLTVRVIEKMNMIKFIPYRISCKKNPIIFFGF